MANVQGAGTSLPIIYETVKYVTPDGKIETGFLIDKKTYKDRRGQVRIDIGSIVKTSVGLYKLTSNGGVKVDGVLSDHVKKEKTTIKSEKPEFKRKIDSKLGEDEYINQGRNDDYFQNFEGLEIEVDFGRGNKVDILSNVFLRDSQVKIDGSGRPLSKVFKFIAQDLKEVD